MKINRKFKEVMALAMMMALASKKVNKGRLRGGGDAAIPSRTIFAATSSSQSCDRRDLVNHHLWGVRSDQSDQSDQSDHCAYYLPYNPSSLQEIKVEEPLASFS